jgi:hypothetical protein
MPAFLVAYARDSGFKLTAYQYGRLLLLFLYLLVMIVSVLELSRYRTYLVKCIGLNYFVSHIKYSSIMFRS